MEDQKFVDFMTILPEEMWENILCRLMEDPLSNEDFTNCRLVCRNWNEKISSNSQLWKAAVQKLGLNVKKEPDIGVDYKNLFSRMRKRLQKMKNGGELFCVEELKLPVPVVADYMHYHNGFVAIGSCGSIHILELEPNLRVVSKAHIGEFGIADCIHFDDSFFVAGTNEGYVVTLKMPTLEMMHTKMSQSDEISCVTFNEDIDLLVTASKANVTFWRLSSGTFHFTRTIGDYDMKDLHLIPTLELQKGCDYMLLCINCDSSYKLHFNSQQITTAQVNPFSVPNLFAYDQVCLDCYFRNSFLYFLSYSKSSESSILLKCDPAGCISEEIWRFNCFRAKLVGVGKKYACILRDLGFCGPREVIFYDLETESQFASFKIPVHLCRGAVMELDAYLVDGCFLDGFDGFNDKGVILVVRYLDCFYVLKWQN